MSWKRQYRCARCGYEAGIYEGKGFMGQKIVTVACLDCHTLQPLVLGGVVGQSAPLFNTMVDRLCLNCGSSHIREWDGETCPRCGGTMKPTGEREFWT